MNCFLLHRCSRVLVWGAALVAALLWTSMSALATSAGALYQCPRNLFTNQIDEVQARLQGCSRVAPGRLTQGLRPQVAPSQAAVLLAAPAVPGGAPESAPVAVTAATGAGDPDAVAATPASAVPVAQTAPAVPAAPSTAVAPRSTTTVRAPEPAGMRLASIRQRVRDQDARAILQTELARVVLAQRGAEHMALNRLREDEAALRREIARFNP